MNTDEQRLKFIMQDLESFWKVEKDRYEFAIDVAEEHGRMSPTAEDELEGFRRMLDEAMIVFKFKG